MNVNHLFTIRKPFMRVAVIFAWYDLWIGAYIDWPEDRGDMWRVFVMVPMVGLMFSGPEPSERLSMLEDQ